MEDESFEENLEQYFNGYERGEHPSVDGAVSRVFDFAPVPYPSKEKLRNRYHEFIHQVRTKLSDISYIFIGRVRLEITLYFEEEKLEKTPDIADLDNYAKAIGDALKGPESLLIDDSQIQSLHISWIDTLKEPYFKIEIESHFPHLWKPKPLALYEMPDKLYYPFNFKEVHSNSIDKQHLEHFREIISIITKARHEARQQGMDKLDAEYYVTLNKPILPGFHKTRVANSGFQLYKLNEWLKE
jgi:Holliday junction resolvase RusA-like endonuclease